MGQQQMFELTAPQAIRAIRAVSNGVEFEAIYQEPRSWYTTLYHVAPWQENLRLSHVSGFNNHTMNDAPKFIRLGSEWCGHPATAPLGIPDEILHTLRAFGELWFPLAQWCALDKWAEDLLRSTPTLLWMVLYRAICAAEQGRSELPSNLLTLSQKHIVRSLGGIGRSTEVRVLRKLQLRTATAAEYETLLMALSAGHLDGWKPYRHWETIPIEFLEFLLRNPDALNVGVLQRGIEAVTNPTDPYVRAELRTRELHRICQPPLDYLLEKISRLTTDTRHLAEAEGCEAAASDVLDRCTTPNDIKRYHDRLVQRVNERVRARRARSVAPSPDWRDETPVLVEGTQHFKNLPPLPGSHSVVPIETSEDLEAEGLYMGHCVGSYQAKINAGRLYVYRVLSPERATASISVYGKKVFVNEVSLAGNRLPNLPTMAAIRAWIQDRGFQVAYVVSR